MKTYKELRKQIINDTDCNNYIAYNKKGEIEIYNPCNTLVPEEYRICNLVYDGYNKPYRVSTEEELQNLVEALNKLEDIHNIGYNRFRLDAYYRNGRKAIAVTVK